MRPNQRWKASVRGHSLGTRESCLSVSEGRTDTERISRLFPKSVSETHFVSETVDAHGSERDFCSGILTGVSKRNVNALPGVAGLARLLLDTPGTSILAGTRQTPEGRAHNEVAQILVLGIHRATQRTEDGPEALHTPFPMSSKRMISLPFG